MLFIPPQINIKPNGQVNYTKSRLENIPNRYGLNLAISYSTIIGVFLEVDKIYLETARSYSTTTSHHKTLFKRIAAYNNFKTIEVKPETLEKIINKDITLKTILTEEKQKQDLTKLLKLNLDYKKAAYEKIKIYETLQIINKSKTGEKTIEYKNGNTKTITNHKTNFKYVSNTKYKITNHHKKTKALSYPIGTQKAKHHTIEKINTRSVIYY